MVVSEVVLLVLCRPGGHVQALGTDGGAGEGQGPAAEVGAAEAGSGGAKRGCEGVTAGDDGAGGGPGTPGGSSRAKRARCDVCGTEAVEVAQAPAGSPSVASPVRKCHRCGSPLASQLQEGVDGEYVDSSAKALGLASLDATVLPPFPCARGQGESTRSEGVHASAIGDAGTGGLGVGARPGGSGDERLSASEAVATGAAGSSSGTGSIAVSEACVSLASSGEVSAARGRGGVGARAVGRGRGRALGGRDGRRRSSGEAVSYTDGGASSEGQLGAVTPADDQLVGGEASAHVCALEGERRARRVGRRR